MFFEEQGAKKTPGHPAGYDPGPDLATYLLLQILIAGLPATINSLECVKKGNLHFSYVIEAGLLRKYLVITTQMSKLKNFLRNFCLSKQEVFRKLPVQKTDRTGTGQVPVSSIKLSFFIIVRFSRQECI